MSLLSTQVERLPDNRCWELTKSDEGWHYLAFAEETILTPEIVGEITQELIEIHEKNPIHLLVRIQGITDVLPAASTALAAAPRSTRLALLGSSHVDQVLAGFMMCDLRNPRLAKYVTDLEEAKEHFNAS